MEYLAINRILDAIAGRLRAIEQPELPGVSIFAEVRTVCLSGYENLFRLLPDLALFPAAIVSAGSHAFPHLAAARELEIAVIVIDEFRVDAAAAAAGFDLLDQVVSGLTGAQPGQALALDGANLITDSILPLELDSDHAAWQYNLKATAGFVRH